MIFNRLFLAMSRFSVACANLGLLPALKLFASRRSADSSITHLKTKRFGDIYFRPKGDYAVITHLYTQQARLVSAKASPDIRTILDLGSNIGMEAIRFRKLFPGARIIAVEASADNFAVLEKNASAAGNITPIHAGIWNKDVCLKIVRPDGGDNQTFRVIEVDKSEAHDFPATTVASILDKYNLEQVDILKVDIEGAESKLFDQTCDPWLHKVNCIIVEAPDNDSPLATQLIFRTLERNKIAMNVYVHGENLILVRSELDWKPAHITYYK